MLFLVLLSLVPDVWSQDTSLYPELTTSTTVIDTFCGTNYGGNEGEILSPNWPGNYPSNVDCNVTITVPGASFISLKSNFFSLEQDDDDCDYDYLEIYKGLTPSAGNKIGQFCSNLLLNVNGGFVYLHFVSDQASSGRGFNISYKAFFPMTTASGPGSGLETTTSTIMLTTGSKRTIPTLPTMPTMSRKITTPKSSTVDPCKNYKSITDSWRNVANKIPLIDYYKCDNNNGRLLGVGGWYRVQGAAGNKLADTCVGPISEICGTHDPMWLQGSHPNATDGIVRRKICVRYSQDTCCSRDFRLNNLYAEIKKCPGGYYVYNLPIITHNWCQKAYCTVKDTSDPCLDSKCRHGCKNVNGVAKCTCPSNLLKCNDEKIGEIQIG